MNRRGAESTEKTSGNRAVVWRVSLRVLPLCSLCLCGSFTSGDPAAWGSDHVGKPIPEYVTGDECLFCHRADVGPSWSMNRHHRTIREADAEAAPVAALKASPPLQPLAAEVKLLLGGSQQLRYR